MHGRPPRLSGTLPDRARTLWHSAPGCRPRLSKRDYARNGPLANKEIPGDQRWIGVFHSIPRERGLNEGAVDPFVCFAGRNREKLAIFARLYLVSDLRGRRFDNFPQGPPQVHLSSLVLDVNMPPVFVGIQIRKRVRSAGMGLYHPTLRRVRGSASGFLPLRKTRPLSAGDLGVSMLDEGGFLRRPLDPAILLLFVASASLCRPSIRVFSHSCRSYIYLRNPRLALPIRSSVFAHQRGLGLRSRDAVNFQVMGLLKSTHRGLCLRSIDTVNRTTVIAQIVQTGLHPR